MWFYFYLLNLISVISGKNCLFPGDKLGIGEYLTSNNGLYSLKIMERGNVCVYDINGKRWCSGWTSPSAWQLNLTNVGKFGVVKTNNICVWAPHNPITTMMSNIQYIMINDNANFLVYNNSGLAWSCKQGTFTNPANSSCPIIGTSEVGTDSCNSNYPSSKPTSYPTSIPTSSKPTSYPTSIPTSSKPTSYPTSIPTSSNPTPSPTPPNSYYYSTTNPTVSSGVLLLEDFQEDD